MRTTKWALPLLFICSWALPATAQVLMPADVPGLLPGAVRSQLTARHKDLLAELDVLTARTAAFNAEYANVVEGSPKVRQALKDQEDLRVLKEAYVAGVARFDTDVKAAVQRRVEELTQKSSRTLAEIKKTAAAMQGYQAALQKWATLPREAREKAHRTVATALASVLIEGLTARNEKAVELTNENLTKIMTYLSGLRTLRVRGLEELATLKTDADVLHLLKTVNEGLATTRDSETKDTDQALTIILRVTSLVNRDPKIGLLIAGGEIWIDAAYGWWIGKKASECVDQLLDLEDMQLRTLKALTTMYKSDIDDRNALRELLSSPEGR